MLAPLRSRASSRAPEFRQVLCVPPAVVNRQLIRGAGDQSRVRRDSAATRAAARRSGSPEPDVGLGGIERGECNPSLDILVKLAEGLETTVSAIFAAARV
jgi:hypothetical protein